MSPELDEVVLPLDEEELPPELDEEVLPPELDEEELPPDDEEVLPPELDEVLVELSSETPGSELEQATTGESSARVRGSSKGR
ncbi:hypothetical protein [Sorangium sp. So ce145]|uniref:hypothetical protein n=1 Tax=Sorangium sp. So ce145 TaxID=3133285 RepID=UPI003F5DE4C6